MQHVHQTKQEANRDASGEKMKPYPQYLQQRMPPYTTYTHSPSLRTP